MLSLFITILTVSTADMVITSNQTLKPFNDDTYVFTWNIDETMELINITLDCKTTGWVGFGLSDTGMMPGSDLTICYVSSQSIATCVDGYAQGYSFAKDDAIGGTNDITNVKGSVSNGRTVISFSKKISSTDNYDKKLSKGTEMKVLFSYRTQGNPSTENGAFNQHSAKVSTPVTLWQGSGTSTSTGNATPSYKTEAGMHMMSIGVNKLSLPNKKTYYGCTPYNIKTMTQNITKMASGLTYHAVAFEAAIDNIKRVHHIVIYSCKDTSGVATMTDTIDCTENKYYVAYCPDILIVWTPGASSIVMPDVAGVVWGSYDTEYIMIETHYDNPDLLSNEVDSTSFNVYFTTKLRQYDAGMMTFGKYPDKISVPPGIKAYDIPTTCGSTCTNTQGGNITVFAYQPHGHQIMSKLYSNIVNADGSKFTLKEDPFSFHSQLFIQLPTPIILTPGWSATTICTYDSSGKTVVTKGGVASDQEMCANFVMYYPRENGLTWCIDDGAPVYGCVKGIKVDRVISGEYFGFSYLLILLLAFII
jgi:hypothetical protein